MVEICPYCSEEQSALKNHVRLASGEGHGPSGQYPADFGDDPEPDPDPGGDLEGGLPLDHGDADPDEPPKPVPDGGTDGGAVAVEAVEETETRDPPAVDGETDDEEGLIAMPESELNTMLREVAATAGDAVSGGDESEESADVDEDSTSLDADTVAKKADESGWGLGAVVALFLLVAFAGIAWARIQSAAENARQKGQELSPGAGPSVDYV